MARDHEDNAGVGPTRDAGNAVRDPDYLTYANIRHLIDQHLEERSLMLDVQTRFLLSQLSATAGARAERKRAELEAALNRAADRSQG
jgi:hypothetical protein